jgi:hypothetical protein
MAPLDCRALLKPPSISASLKAIGFPTAWGCWYGHNHGGSGHLMLCSGESSLSLWPEMTWLSSLGRFWNWLASKWFGIQFCVHDVCDGLLATTILLVWSSLSSMKNDKIFVLSIILYVLSCAPYAWLCQIPFCLHEICHIFLILCFCWSALKLANKSNSWLSNAWNIDCSLVC